MSALPADFKPLSRAELERRYEQLATMSPTKHIQRHLEELGTALWLTERGAWTVLLSYEYCDLCPSIADCGINPGESCIGRAGELRAWLGMEPQP